jgi:hypothetical protein
MEKSWSTQQQKHVRINNIYFPVMYYLCMSHLTHELFLLNRCFLNVILQCLVYTRPLLAYLIGDSYGKECKLFRITHMKMSSTYI